MTRPARPASSDFSTPSATTASSTEDTATASAAVPGNPPNFALLPELTGNIPPGHTFIPGVSGQADSYQQTEKSFALFTNETYTLIEHLDLTAGLRYTHESKDETANYNSPDGGSACGQLLHAPPPSAGLPYYPPLLLGYGCATPFNSFFAGVTHGQSLTEDNLNATVKLAYRFTDDVMGYASWGNGTKAGGFNLARVTNPNATATAPAGTFQGSTPCIEPSTTFWFRK